MRVLVTGSSGLVGREVCRQLETEGAQVVPFDLRTGQDVRVTAHWQPLLERPDAVIHLAAVSRPAWVAADPGAAAEVNLQATKWLADACRGLEIPLVFASSREVFGDNEDAHEGSLLAPMNEYARQKALAQQAVLDAGGYVRILSNVYGSTLDHPDRLVPAFARAAAYGTPIRVDDPEASYDLCPVGAVAAHLVDLARDLARRKSRKRLHLLATGQSTTVGQLSDWAQWLSPGGVLPMLPPVPHLGASRFRARCGSLPDAVDAWDGFVALVGAFRADSAK